jgi:hypothetical protein
MSPRLIIQATDLNSRMTVSRVVNKSAMTNKHSRMRNVTRFAPKEEKISSTHFFCLAVPLRSTRLVNRRHAA